MLNWFSLDKPARLRFSICQTQPKLLQLLRLPCMLNWFLKEVGAGHAARQGDSIKNKRNVIVFVFVFVYIIVPCSSALPRVRINTFLLPFHSKTNHIATSNQFMDTITFASMVPRSNFLLLLLWCSRALIHDSTKLSTDVLRVA